MQIQFTRIINFPTAISIEVEFMNPLHTLCSRQFCMQVQEGKRTKNSVFHLQDIEGHSQVFKMPRFLSSEKSEVRKKSREENDYGSIASLLRNEVSKDTTSLQEQNLEKSLIFNQLFHFYHIHPFLRFFTRQDRLRAF